MLIELQKHISQNFVSSFCFDPVNQCPVSKPVSLETTRIFVSGIFFSHADRTLLIKPKSSPIKDQQWNLLPKLLHKFNDMQILMTILSLRTQT